jgi:hypothetical protein
MSRRLMKLGVAAALLVTALVGASSSQAHWTTNGTPTGTIPYTMSAGPSLLSISAPGGGLQGFTCMSTSAAKTIHNKDIVRPDGTKIGTQHVVNSAGCNLGGLNAAVSCDTAFTYEDGVSYSPSTNVTTLHITGIFCQITKPGCGNSTTVTGGITVTGSYLAEYGNTSQQLAISPTGQSLVANWSSSGCLSGTSPGAATLTNNLGTALVYSVTSAFKPQISN